MKTANDGTPLSRILCGACSVFACSAVWRRPAPVLFGPAHRMLACHGSLSLPFEIASQTFNLTYRNLSATLSCEVHSTARRVDRAIPAPVSQALFPRCGSVHLWPRPSVFICVHLWFLRSQPQILSFEHLQQMAPWLELKSPRINTHKSILAKIRVCKSFGIRTYAICGA